MASSARIKDNFCCVDKIEQSLQIQRYFRHWKHKTLHFVESCFRKKQPLLTLVKSGTYTGSWRSLILSQAPNSYLYVRYTWLCVEFKKMKYV